MKEFSNDVKKEEKKYALYLFIVLIVFPFVGFFLGRFLFSNGLVEKEVYNLNLQNFLIISPIFITLQYIIYKDINKDIKKRDKFLFNMIAILSCIIYLAAVFIIFNSSKGIEFKLFSSFLLLISPYYPFFIRDIVNRKIYPKE